MQEQLPKSPYPWHIALIWLAIGMVVSLSFVVIADKRDQNRLLETLSSIEGQEANDLPDGITSVVPTFARLCEKYPCYGTIEEGEEGEMAFRGLHPDVEWSTGCEPIPGELEIGSQVVVYGPASLTGTEHRISRVRCSIPTITLRPTVEYQYHDVVTGDWLSKIAQKYLGSADRWPEIWEWNRDAVGENPHLILPGTRIQIQHHHPENVTTIGFASSTEDKTN